MKVSWTRESTFLVRVAMLKTHGVYLRPHSVSEPLQARCCCLIRPTYCGTIVCAAAITGPTGSNMCTVLLPLCGSFVGLLQLWRKKKIKKWRSQELMQEQRPLVARSLQQQLLHVYLWIDAAFGNLYIIDKMQYIHISIRPGAEK